MTTWFKELTHWKRPWCWERLKVGGGDDRDWDGWMASPTQRTWVWINSRSGQWIGRPGKLQSMGLQKVRHDWATELNWTDWLTWLQSHKWQNDLCFQGKPLNITVIQVYALITNAKEVEVEQFYEDLQDLLELTPKKKKRCPIHHRRLEWKVGCQEISGVTGKFGLGVQNEAGKSLRVLSRECTGQRKHPLPTTQETSPDCQYQNQIDYIPCSRRWRSSIQSAKRPRANCGSDHELLIAKLRVKLKKVGKTSRPLGMT